MFAAAATEACVNRMLRAMNAIVRPMRLLLDSPPAKPTGPQRQEGHGNFEPARPCLGADHSALSFLAPSATPTQQYRYATQSKQYMDAHRSHG